MCCVQSVTALTHHQSITLSQQIAITYIIIIRYLHVHLPHSYEWVSFSTC